MDKTPNLPAGPCRLPYWLGRTIPDLKAIEIDFNGHITLCPGICIGNLKTQSLTNILGDYDPHKHPILNALIREGPIGLTKIADDLGIVYD
jgi:hypothetical protein